MGHSRSHARLVLGAIVALVTACAPGATNNSNNSSNNVHGGSVSVIGQWADGELDTFNKVVKPFED